jgi:hypothetical protein
MVASGCNVRRLLGSRRAIRLKTHQWPSKPVYFRVVLLPDTPARLLLADAVGFLALSNRTAVEPDCHAPLERVGRHFSKGLSAARFVGRFLQGVCNVSFLSSCLIHHVRHR